jgi:TonB family protein
VTFTATRELGPGRYMALNSSIPEYNSGGPILNDRGQVAGIVVRVVDNGETVNLVGSVSSINSVRLAEPKCSTAASDEPIPQRTAGGLVGSGPIAGIPAGGAGSPSASSMPQIIRKSGGVLQGSALRRAEPLYPPLAKAARVSGSVVVEVTVDQEGDVISSRAISGHPLLKDAAVNAAHGWKFSPTMLQGIPVKVIGTITFNFNL